jgi:hypothetical protein
VGEKARTCGSSAPAEPGSSIRLPRLPQHRHELTAPVRQREWNDLLLVAAPVHVADDLIWLPAHVLQVFGPHVERAEIRPHLGQGCVGSPGQRGGTMGDRIA